MPVSLNEIVENKRAEIAIRKTQSLLIDTVQALTSPLFQLALSSPDTPLKLILEIKPASPSLGIIQAEINLDQILPAYNQFASAISVLTDEKYFKGSLALLTQVTQQSSHPVLCKDFIIDPYQVYEARRAGAHAVLLIVKILRDDELLSLFKVIKNLGMTAVIEIQNQTELSRALVISPEVILINNRNLETFVIDFETTQKLAPLIPEEIIIISASGIETRSDIERLLPSAHCFLIGSALMKTPATNLSDKLKALLDL